MSSPPRLHRPHVDPWVKKIEEVYVAHGIEVDLVDPQTGIVVYSTPNAGHARRRARDFARRHHLRLVARPEGI